MFGSYRLLLAALVAVSHMARPMLEFNVGVVAVVQFYLVSGFVMTALIERHYPAIPPATRPGDAPILRPTLRFYADRALRIYPQYLLFAGLTLALHHVFHFDSLFLEGDFDARALLFNLLIIPLDFFMFDPSIQTATLIPPAWSLGAELQFYLLFPLLLAWPRTLLPVTWASVGIFGLAMLGVVHSDWYGYRLLPGVLFMFLTGCLLFRARTSLAAARWTVAIYATVAALGAAAWWTHGLTEDKTAECLTGYLVGVPIVFALSRLATRHVDDVLGWASYGTFLVHNLVMFVMESLGILPRLIERNEFMAVAIAISIAVGWAGYFLVERPVVAFRRGLRRSSEGTRTV